jgi:SAM-dependent methyltransferase
VNGDLHAQPFDAAAPRYDAQFSRRIPAQWLRAMVHRRVDPLLANNSLILEIGCGTGEDAVHFARQGHRVFATDVSEGMLEETRRKRELEPADIRHRITVATLDAAEPAFPALAPGSDVDLVFSNFGALNCVADLEPVIGFAHEVLRPGGHLAMTIMGRYCPWEVLGFALRGDFARATRRWKGVSDWHRDGATQRVWYPAISATRSLCRKKFLVDGLFGIGALLPSTEFFGACERWPRLFRGVARVEDILAPYWPLNRFNDHFLIVAKKAAR